MHDVSILFANGPAEVFTLHREKRWFGKNLIMSWKTLPFSKAWRFVSYNEDLRTKDVQLWCPLGDFRWFWSSCSECCSNIHVFETKCTSGLRKWPVFSLLTDNIARLHLLCLTDLHLFQQNPMHFWWVTCYLQVDHTNQQFMQVNIPVPSWILLLMEEIRLTTERIYIYI